VAIVHDGKEPAHQCKICNSTFLYERSMKNHMISVHENAEKKLFTCSICSKNYNSRPASVHGEKKRFKCDICDAEFTSLHGKKKHVSSIHDRKKAISFCKTCNSTFTCVKSLKRHMILVHESAENKSTSLSGQKSPVSSLHAGIKRNNLKTHISPVHEEKNSFNCEICGDLFSREGTMKKHKFYVHDKNNSSKNEVGK
jgi:hypothetical protein